MRLTDYLKWLGSSEARETFAAAVESSVGHLRNVGYGYRPCDEQLAVRIEKQSGGLCTRQELRPDDYWLSWPDLPAPEAAAAVAGEG